MRFQRATLVDTLESLSSSRRYGHLIPTHEQIGFQNNDRFGPDLEVICAKFDDLVKQGMSAKAIEGMTDLKKEFELLIQTRLGLKVKLVTNGYAAATLANYYTPNNVVANDYLRGYLQTNKSDTPGIERLKGMENKSLGTVNLATAKMTGWFSEQECPLYMNWRKLHLEGPYSPAELAAIVLHELGHVFNVASFINHTHSANQIIADIAANIKTNAKDNDVEYIYREIKKLDKDASADIAQGLASGNAPVMGVSMYRLAVGTVQSLMSEKTYDRVTNEALADSFATRFGYGAPLITGLEKIDAHYPELLQQRERGALQIALSLYFLVFAIGTLAGPIAGGIMIPLMFVNGLYTYLMGMILNFISGSEGQARIYDNMKVRYARIRNAMVEHIKDPDLSKELRKNLLRDITIADEVVANKRTHVTLIDSLFDIFSPRNRRAMKSIEAQQNIETLIANKLFVQANKLKV